MAQQVDVETVGIEALDAGMREVPEQPVGRNLAIGVGGILIVIAALVPVAAAAVYVGGFMIAGAISLAQGA